jgi:hypothetical protein
VLWNASSQFLIINGTCVKKFRKPKNSPVSKTIISCIVAAIFDPLSLINPIVVHTNIPAAAGASQLYWDVHLRSELLK